MLSNLLRKRLILGLSGLLICSWGGTAIVHCWLIKSGQDFLGTPLSINSTRVSLWNSALELEGVALHHPHSPEQVLLECPRITVDIEGVPLTRRKLIVREIRAAGLQLQPNFAGNQESSSGAPLPSGWELAQQTRTTENWFQTVQQQLQAQAPDQANSLEHLSRLKELLPRRIMELENQLAILELRLEWLSEISADTLPGATASAEPGTANAEQIHEAARSLTIDWQKLRENVAELRLLWEADRQALLASHVADMARPRSTADLPPLDAAALSAYLLHEEINRRGWEVLQLVKAGAELLPDATISAEHLPFPGMNIPFPERQPLPGFLVKALHFDGSCELHGLPVTFAGTLQNLSSEPQRVEQATRLVIDAQAPHRIVIEATLDRRGETPHDHVVVRSPAWEQPEWTLGNPAQLAIQLPPGLLVLRAELALAQGQLTGTIRFQRELVELVPQMADGLGGPQLNQALIELLAGVEVLDAELAVTGPLTDPRIRLNSRCGEKVALCLEQSMQHEMQERATRLALLLNQGFQESVAELEKQLTDEQTSLLARLEAGDAQVLRLVAQVERKFAGPVAAGSVRTDRLTQQLDRSAP